MRAARGALPWLALAFATALAYLWGLDGLNIPKFGDEMVYTHIARRTADSGHWLPLQSEYAHMRNTKPPLLFWQAMVAGQWGADWRMGALRLPAVIYTWATALMAALLAARMCRLRSGPAAAGNAPAMQPLAAGAIAAAVYLLFFSTIRYSRTYLTSGPETFWMFGVMAALAWTPVRMLGSKLWFPLAAGAAIGVACLYKSFVLVVPMGFALLLCHLWVRERGRAPVFDVRALPAMALKLAISTVLALAVFSLWFVLDPSPADIWREFVVGENVGRMKSGPGYLSVAFGGASGVWVILVACFSNAGLLLPVVAGAAVAAWQAARRGERAGHSETVLWLWIAALTLFFLVPSQRSARYLIPAMPAVAVLVALYWQQIHRAWFLATAVLSLGTLAVMALIGWGGTQALGDAALYPPAFWAMLALMAASAIGAFAMRRFTPVLSLTAALGVLLAMTGAYAPFNGPAGNFSPQVVQALRGQTVWVAYQFTGQTERYGFLLPGVKIAPVAAPLTRTADDLDAMFANGRYVLMQGDYDRAPCQRCRVVDARWEPGNRPGSRGIDAILHPEKYWFSREYIVERPLP